MSLKLYANPSNEFEKLIAWPSSLGQDGGDGRGTAYMSRLATRSRPDSKSEDRTRCDNRA